MADVEKELTDLQNQETQLQAQKTELEKLKSETAEYEKKKSALDQELSRVQKLIDDSREAKRGEEKTFAQKSKEENFARAKNRLFEKYGYKDDAQTQQVLLEAYKKLDSGAVTEENIYDDLLSAHVHINKDKLLSLEDREEKSKQEAAKLQVQQSSSGFSGAGEKQTSEVQLDQDDIQAARWANVPLEEYRRLKAKGLIY